MSLFRTPYGLPTRFEFESSRHIENEFLFGMYEYMFTDRKPLHHLNALVSYYNKAYTARFPNHVNESVPEKEISHDQLTAYVAYSKLFDVPGTLEINQNICGLEYEALEQERTLHPRDLIYYRLADERYQYLLLLPFYYLFAVFSLLIGYRITKDEVDRPDQIARFGKFIIRTKLSGELLWILRCYSVKDNRVLKLAHLPVKYIIKFGAWLRFGSVQRMVSSYFQDRTDHPIVFNYNFDF
jgi:hypothetical protein